MSLRSAVIKDVQTTVTSGLVGAVGGQISTQLGDKIVQLLKIRQSGKGLGTLGVEFVLRSAVSSLVYIISAQTFPQSAENAFFPYVFFFADTGLTRVTVGVGTYIVNSFTAGINKI